jgi:hypothetical protein
MDSSEKKSRVLKWAAVYNVAWGSLMILWPNLLFDWADLPRPNYPEIWQCVGMIVGVYGIGYWVAAYDPYTHWPVVLVGFLGKIFGPIGFIEALINGPFNWKFGLTIITNDLIWWIPFSHILWGAFKHHTTRPDLPVPPSLGDLSLSGGRSLVIESFKRPLVLVLVRHSGCTFCRESLADLGAYLSVNDAEKDHRKFGLCVVHMGTEQSSLTLQKKYGLKDVEFIADPERRFYQALRAPRGRFTQLFGPRVFWRGFVAGILKGHGVGRLEGDGFQLGGTYLVKNGVSKPLHEPKDAADVDDWDILFKVEALKN